MAEDDRDRGAVLPIVALSLVFLMTMTAFTIDLGREMLSNRDLQKVSDLTALDLSRRLDGRTVNQINADTTFTQQMFTSATRNGFPIQGARSLSYQLGSVDRTTREFHQLHGTSIPNAVRVLAGDNVQFFFAPGSRDTAKSAVGLGTTTPLCQPPDPPCTPLIGATTDFEVGSFLASASLDATHVKLLNALFSRVGSGVNLDAVSYQGIANSQVTIRQLSAALGLASPNDLFTATVGYRALLNAAASALSSNGGSATAVTALQAIALTTNTNTQIDLSTLLRRGSGFSANSGNGSGFDSAIKLLNFLEGSAYLINGNSAISIPNLSFGIPGITNVDASLKVIESPGRLYGAVVGETLSTSQVDLTLTVTVDLDLSAIRVGERLRGTIVVHPTAGSAVASPTLIACPGNGAVAPQDQIQVNGSAVSTTGNESLTLSAQVGLAVVDVLSTTINSASVAVPATSGTATFLYTTEFEPPAGTAGTKRVATPALSLSTGFDATTSNSTVIGTPLIPLATLVSETNQGLNASILAPLESNAISKIMGTLGLQIGGADVGAMDIHCVGPALVR